MASNPITATGTADRSGEDRRAEAFTPGPWAVGNLDKNDQRIVSGPHFEICTCWHHSVGSIEKEMEANAQLIAAAPDMLAALEAVARENLDVVLAKQVRAAISKATGA